MIRQDRLRFGEAQPLPEHADQRLIECKRTALKNHGSGDIQTLCQTANGLLCNSVQGGKGQILLGYALIQQGLDVCFGIDTAAAGNVINALALSSQRVEFLYRYVEDRGNFVDESAGATGAASVHTHVSDFCVSGNGVFPEEQDFRVLTAKLDGGADFLITGLEGNGVCHDLLNV